MHPHRTLARLGQRLHDAWIERRKNPAEVSAPWNRLADAWNELARTHRQLRKAIERGFVHCLPSLTEDWQYRLDSFHRAFEPMRTLHRPPERDPSLADWVAELAALEAEFGTFTFDEKRCLIRVTTDPITLEGVALGPFAIELFWNRFKDHRGSPTFDVVALQPNPASNRDDVTHPHVNETELCAGDAAVPLERALTEGRISDAFTMIDVVLKTYNRRSAFVQLSEWDGLQCGDCGGRMSREQGTYCRGCETDLCDSCSSCCRSCDETRCAECLTSCDGCNDHCCRGCLETIDSGDSLCSACRGVCGKCHTVLAASELDDDGNCPKCVEAAEPDPAPSEEEPAHAP